MIGELLGTLVWWHWLVLAMVLLVIEIAAPVMWFLWVALAAGLLALITLVVPGISWPWQVIIFGIATIASLFVGRRVFQGERKAHDAPALNRRNEQHVGRVYTLSEAIVNGTGAASVGDTRWQVVGDDMPIGTAVRVTRVNGTRLHVVAEASGDAASSPN